jgi:hypothetical protein
MPKIAHPERLSPDILKELSSLKSMNLYASTKNRISGYDFDSETKKPLKDSEIKELRAVVDITAPDEMGFYTLSSKGKTEKSKEKDK